MKSPDRRNLALPIGPSTLKVHRKLESLARRHDRKRSALKKRRAKLKKKGAL